MMRESCKKMFAWGMPGELLGESGRTLQSVGDYFSRLWNYRWRSMPRRDPSLPLHSMLFRWTLPMVSTRSLGRRPGKGEPVCIGDRVHPYLHQEHLIPRGIRMSGCGMSVEWHSSRYGVPGTLFVDNGTQLIALTSANFTPQNLGKRVEGEAGHQSGGIVSQGSRRERESGETDWTHQADAPTDWRRCTLSTISVDVGDKIRKDCQCAE